MIWPFSIWFGKSEKEPELDIDATIIETKNKLQQTEKQRDSVLMQIEQKKENAKQQLRRNNRDQAKFYLRQSKVLEVRL